MNVLLVILPLVFLGVLVAIASRFRSPKADPTAIPSHSIGSPHPTDAMEPPGGDSRRSRDRLSSTFAETPQALARKSHVDS